MLFFPSPQDVKNRRNPRLVPYILLDERTKKSNKDSLKEAVRTLLGYGYNLEAPDHDHGIVIDILHLNIVSFLEKNQIAHSYPVFQHITQASTRCLVSGFAFSELKRPTLLMRESGTLS